MRQLAVLVATVVLLGTGSPVVSAPAPTPAPGVPSPERFAPAPPEQPQPDEDHGCVLPVSSSLLPCPGERPRRPAESCVLPLHDLGSLVTPCPEPAPAPESRTIPLQSASEE